MHAMRAPRSRNSERSNHACTDARTAATDRCNGKRPPRPRVLPRALTSSSLSLAGPGPASLRCERFGAARAAHVRMDPCDPCRRDRRSVSGPYAAVRARCAYVYVRTRATGCLMLCCLQAVLPRNHLPTGGREQRKHTRTGMHSLSAPMPG